jgi:hypothetical protein
MIELQELQAVMTPIMNKLSSSLPMGGMGGMGGQGMGPPGGMGPGDMPISMEQLQQLQLQDPEAF